MLAYWFRTESGHVKEKSLSDEGDESCTKIGHRRNAKEAMLEKRRQRKCYGIIYFYMCCTKVRRRLSLLGCDGVWMRGWSIFTHAIQILQQDFQVCLAILVRAPGNGL